MFVLVILLLSPLQVQQPASRSSQLVSCERIAWLNYERANPDRLIAWLSPACIESLD